MNCPKCEMWNDFPISKPELTYQYVWVLHLFHLLLAGATIEITQIESSDDRNEDSGIENTKTFSFFMADGVVSVERMP